MWDISIESWQIFEAIDDVCQTYKPIYWKFI